MQTDCKQSLRFGKVRALNGCTGRISGPPHDTKPVCHTKLLKLIHGNHIIPVYNNGQEFLGHILHLC